MIDKTHFTFALKVGDTVCLEPKGNAVYASKSEPYMTGKVTAVTSRTVHIEPEHSIWAFKLPLGTSEYRNFNDNFGFSVFPSKEAAETELNRREKITAIRDMFNRQIWQCEKEVLTAEQIDKIYDIISQEHKEKAGKQFVIKMTEEECEDDYFVITAPSGLTEKEIERDIEMAKKYICVAADFDGKMTDEQPNGYDEHFKEMLNYRVDSNGEYTFLHYLELLGYTVDALVEDFEVEW